jgi:hypothetical protein
MATKQKKGSGGQKKLGRNKIWCAAYRLRGQREKNKKANLKRHLARHPNDGVAKKAI